MLVLFVRLIFSFEGGPLIKKGGHKKIKLFASDKDYFWRRGNDNRVFKQITTVTSTTAVVDAESWGEYVTVARQISTLSKWHPSIDHGVSCSLSFAAMTSFTEARYFIVLSYEQGLISDEEFLVFYDSYKPKNLDLPYNMYESFDLDEMEDDECVADSEFRVRKRDIPLLGEVLQISEVVICNQYIMKLYYFRTLCAKTSTFYFMIRKEKVFR